MNLEKPPVVERFPVMRPALPTFDRLEPYLRRIDAARTYSNYGPIVSEFESRVAERLFMPGCVASASSGTAALIAAILASAGRATPERPFALVPAYTFVATALAVELCGYRPLVADIDAGDWMLSPERVLAQAQRDRIGVVVAVAPYGRAFDRTLWEDLQDRMRIAVVIDAAASFDVFASDRAKALAAFGPLPVALSFHATKSFSSGEGGAVVCADRRLLATAAQSLNFGFAGSRNCGVASLNGKLSEYHAAVGLAELDGWAKKRSGWASIASAYRRAAERTGFSERIHTAPNISGCYALFEAETVREAAAVAEDLGAAGIGSRFWYGDGVQRHDHFAGVACEDVATAEHVAKRVLGLPVALDYTDGDIEAIVATIARTVSGRRAFP